MTADAAPHPCRERHTVTRIRSRTVLRAAALAALLAAAPAAASAQAPGDPGPRRAVSLMLGGFGTDTSEGRTFRIAAARAEVRLRYDQQQFQGQELGAETTVGVVLKF